MRFVEMLSIAAVMLSSEVSRAQTVAAAPRKLEQLYTRRAYHGAPPTIPHAVEAGTANEPARCLTCHLKSAFVPPLQAFAPESPHPELDACTQCHVPSGNAPKFRGSSFAKLEPPRLPGGALATSPPPIPHSLQMREKCAKCHATSATPEEIVCDHPERSGCQQCHVPNSGSAAFARGGEVKP